VCEWQVKLYDPIVTYGSYLSTLEIKGLYIKRYVNSSVYIFFTFYITAAYRSNDLSGGATPGRK